MARPLRIQFPGAIYHVLARGNARQLIFLQHDDRRFFLEELWRACELRNWLIWAYCLMGNHYHLVLETVEPTLSIGMRDLNGRYALEFNRRHGRVGHLFQSRFSARLVQRERYLLELSRYVVLNPVRAGLCESPADWRWSSYRDTAGMRTGASPRLAVDAMLGLFSASARDPRAEFMRFVHAGVGLPAPQPHKDTPLVFGDDAYAAAIIRTIQEPSTEVPREQRLAPPLSEIAAAVTDRDEAIVCAYATGAYKLAEIGRFFGVHYATVSRILNRRRMVTTVDDVAMQDLTP